MRYPDKVWITTSQSELSRQSLDKSLIPELSRNFVANTLHTRVIQTALVSFQYRALASSQHMCFN